MLVIFMVFFQNNFETKQQKHLKLYILMHFLRIDNDDGMEKITIHRLQGFIMKR